MREDFDMGYNAIVDLEARLPGLSKTVYSKDLSIPDAQRELQFWKGKKETSSGGYERVKRYWDSIGVSGWSLTGTPWSAAFISYILRNQDFPGASGHFTYVGSAAKGNTPWRAISIPKNQGKIKLAVGDVLVRPRQSKKYHAGHGDVVFKIENGKAYMAGGNVSDTAKVLSVPVSPDGVLGNAGSYLIVLKRKPKTGSPGVGKFLATAGKTVGVLFLGLVTFGAVRRFS